MNNFFKFDITYTEKNISVMIDVSETIFSTEKENNFHSIRTGLMVFGNADNKIKPFYKNDTIHINAGENHFLIDLESKDYSVFVKLYQTLLEFAFYGFFGKRFYEEVSSFLNAENSVCSDKELQTKKYIIDKNREIEILIKKFDCAITIDSKNMDLLLTNKFFALSTIGLNFFSKDYAAKQKKNTGFDLNGVIINGEKNQETFIPFASSNEARVAYLIYLLAMDVFLNNSNNSFLEAEKSENIFSSCAPIGLSRSFSISF